jgi:hypothetical protein
VFVSHQLQESNLEFKESDMELRTSKTLLTTELATAERTIFDLKIEVSFSMQSSDGLFDDYIQKVKQRSPRAHGNQPYTVKSWTSCGPTLKMTTAAIPTFSKNVVRH